MLSLFILFNGKRHRSGSEMETLALHFRLHSHALYFPVITFVLTYSPERRLCGIIHSAGRGEKGRKHCFQLEQNTANPPHSCLLLRAVGTHSVPMDGVPLLFFPCLRAQHVLERLRNGMAESATVLTLTPLVMGIKTTEPCAAPYLPRISISPNPVQATSCSTSLPAGFGLGRAGSPSPALPGCVGSAGCRMGGLSRGSAQFVFI